jgi:predicted alpha/beta-fold hydrolase
MTTSSWQFDPHPLLRSGHAQTIAAGLWSSVKNIPHRAQTHIVPTTEGDQLLLHDDRPIDGSNGERCALLVHGLGGCHRSPYMVRTAEKLVSRGIRVFRLDLRGCGEGNRIASKPGHAGRSEDVAAAVEHIARQCPHAELAIVGYSLGGNILLKLLAEWEHDAPPQVIRAIAVSPPIDLLACSANMSRPRMMLYNRWFVRALVAQTTARCALVPELARLDWSRPPRTLYEFDDRVTAPLSGFRGAEEYYALSSTVQRLEAIRVPTTVITASDDPIVPVAMFDQTRRSPHVTLHVTRYGGHVAFIARAGRDPDRQWLDWRVVEIVTQTERAAVAAAM